MTADQDRATDPGRATDPRAVRVVVAASPGRPDLPAMILEPPAIPVAPAGHATGLGILGGVAVPGVRPDAAPESPPTDRFVLVDGLPTGATIDGPDERGRAVVAVDDEGGRRREAVLMPGATDGRSGPASGMVRAEVIVGGWRIEVEIEAERRAALRERASRGRQAVAHGGPTEVRAIIPGRVLSVSVVAGDDVVAGQQLLAVEAMKMQNELRAPRDGRITRVAIAPDQTIEVGDLLLVIE